MSCMSTFHLQRPLRVDLEIACETRSEHGCLMPRKAETHVAQCNVTVNMDPSGPSVLLALTRARTFGGQRPRIHGVKEDPTQYHRIIAFPRYRLGLECAPKQPGDKALLYFMGYNGDYCSTSSIPKL
jgi:hypothetical protein